MPTSPSPGAPRRARRITASVIGATALLATALVGLAVAKATTTLGTAKATVAGSQETIVVDSRGVSLYTLSGETTKHLECTPQALPKGMCFRFWPPLKAKSAKAKLSAAKGIKGKLGILHRNGFSQVTLGGRPLYYFMPDAGKKGSTLGEGIRGFGGTWHVIKISSASKRTTTTTHATTTSTSSTYSYP